MALKDVVQENTARLTRRVISGGSNKRGARLREVQESAAFGALALKARKQLLTCIHNFLPSRIRFLLVLIPTIDNEQLNEDPDLYHVTGYCVR